tara:strand:+ start:9593 stop:10342 length:750 start_codon:yes stop_codon:yes gene_type:complete
MKCKNCGEDVDGNYCSHCGQSAGVEKITLSTLAHEISTSIFQLDRGFFFTLKELFVRPGASIRDYLNGKRKQHFKPIAYVLTLSTVYFLISKLTGQNTWMGDIITGISHGAMESEKDLMIYSFLSWFSDNFAYTTLLLLPVYSLTSYVSFKRFGINYPEHVILNSYIIGQQAIIYTLFAFIRLISDHEIFEMLSFIFSFLYAIRVFYAFFEEGNRLVNILRSVSTYLLFFVFFFMMILIGAFVVTLVRG